MSGRPRHRINRIEPEDVDPAFGHWLAGLVDGEGHFQFRLDRQVNGHLSVHAALVIKLRSDDSAALVEIQRTLGVGRTYRMSPQQNSQAQFGWQVRPINDCLWMARFFEAYPLRTKKRRDFEIWAAALRAAANGARRNDLRQYAERIRAVREFDAPTDPKPITETVQAPLEGLGE